MVQVVFVHGVATRSTAAYVQEECNRNLLFREVAFAGAKLEIRSPLWGELVPDIRSSAFPAEHEQDEAFAGMGGLAGEGDASFVIVSDANLANLLREDPTGAVDAICAELVQRADRENRILNDDELAQFKRAAELIETSNLRIIVADDANDDEAFAALKGVLQDGDSYGIVDNIRTAAIAVSDHARNLVSKAISNRARPALNPLVARFLGDIFVYLKAGKLRKAIRQKISGDIWAAHAAREVGEPLILIGHSLGGVILYDMLSAPRSGELPEGFSADLLVTVGSQPGLFEEMNLFPFKPTACDADGRTPGPASVARWINIFDPIDLFGFRAQTVFSKATDYCFNSVTGLLDAHTAYFKRPQFHARLHERLKELELI